MDKSEIKQKLIFIMNDLYYDEFSGLDCESIESAADEIIELFDKIKQDG